MAEVSATVPKRNWIKAWWQSLNSLSRFLIIALAAPLLVLNAWALSAIFGYFESLFVVLLISAVLSFLLGYAVTWLENQGLKRELAAIAVSLITLLIFVAVGITLVPLVFSQAQQLVARLPEWLDSGQRQLMQLDTRIDTMNLPVPISFDGLIAQINSRLGAELQILAGRSLNIALNLTVFTVVRVVDVLLTVILTFYLLLHSPDIWQSLIAWLPKPVQQPFSRTLRSSFQNYFVGQVICATCMAMGLVAAFLFLKVPFGLLFGLLIGTMALIPFGGTVGIITVTALLALRDIGLALQVLAVAVIVQQIVENGVAPRILGSVTGLNPFWVLVAVLTGARVGGLLGVIVAVPTAVMIKEALEVIRETRPEDAKKSVTPSEETISEIAPFSDPSSEAISR
ncbi:AI-2E family transporter [Pannus brasiliensis CCIBt3594]|uniref:AI-2E family transporter n=1 Tax=Pannus brasiliensis CCIBt3594 TaxID=1427578 RepID=A0AAW9R0W6_9CHRO